MGYIGTKPSAVPLTSADITDGIITSAKIADGTIVNADINASAAIVNSKLSGVGITEADMWRLTSSITADVNPISANLERVDNASFAKIGTGMSVASGTWTFPRTGLYYVSFTANISAVSGDGVNIYTYATIDNSNYNELAVSGGSNSMTTTSFVYVNVTNTSNVKVRFEAYSISAGSAINGSTVSNQTSFTFIRLGDSQ